MPNMHKPFHQKYRPSNLDELVGQEFISITLKQALSSQKIAPAYLFNGPRGTGKTSSARIFAKSLNCLAYKQPTSNPCGQCELCKQITDGNALDIIEIDAASNTGVENIREIIDKARFAPTQARWKVYVIDECHMLSTAASNALLKTIEEPPSRVVFILATTNPERVLNTIQSRCQKFDFKRINSNSIFNHLVEIANKESIKFEEQALKLIAKRSNGGMRDAQSLLEQLSLLPNGITSKNVQNLLGEVSENDLINLINSLIYNNPESLLISCNNLYDAGNEPHEILVGLLNITRDLLLKTINNNYSDIFYTSIDFQNELNEFSNNINKSRIIDWHNKLKNVEYNIKTSDNPRLWLEIHLTSLIQENIVTNLNNSKLNINQKTVNNRKFIYKEVDSEKINSPKDSEAEIKNISINKQDINTNSPKDSEAEIKNISINKKDINTNSQNDDLKEKWELILSKLELPSTKMLLSQQAKLASIDSHEVLIALSPNWENMIKSRKVVIEEAVKKVFGNQINLKFSTQTTGITNSEKLKKEIMNNPNVDNASNSNDFKTSNISSEINQTKSNDDSSKNLANFFNGEIVDLDE